jgi:hypothetical protein
MSLASLHRPARLRTTHSRLQSTRAVRNLDWMVQPILNQAQKTHSSSNLPSREALLFANRASRIPHPLQHMVASPPNGNKSIRRLPKSRRPRVTTSAAQSKSSMWHHNHRPNAARHLRQADLLPPARHIRVSGMRNPRKCSPRTVTLRQLVPNRADLPQPLQSLVPSKKLNDQFPTTQPLEMRLPARVLALPQAVHLAQAQDCLLEETRTVSRPPRPLLRRMRRAASHSRRASNTRYPHHMPTLTQLAMWMRALASQAHSEDILFSLAPPVRMERVGTDVQTPSPRHWDV